VFRSEPLTQALFDSERFSARVALSNEFNENPFPTLEPSRPQTFEMIPIAFREETLKMNWSYRRS